MGLQTVGLPDIVDRGLADSLTLGHRPTAPMRHAFRFGLQGRIHNGGDLVDVVGGFASAPCRDLPESVQSLFTKALAPQNHSLAIDGQPLRNGHVGFPFGGGQHDPAAQGHLLRRTVGGHPLLYLLLLGRR